jgi:hypothetical protein
MKIISFLLTVFMCISSIEAQPVRSDNTFAAIEIEALAAFSYLLDEVEKDEALTLEEQQEKVLEFRAFAATLSPEGADYLTLLLLDQTRVRIVEMLQDAGLEPSEIEAHIAGYEEAIANVENMDVEIAREMLFFVAELKIHRHYIYAFGTALGCPEKQLLRHDLCKLDADQFEGYARYFRGGRREEDKPRYLAAWALHQYEEHHHQSYSKPGFDFSTFSEERIRNNMFETVTDLLAASKQRGGATLIEYLTQIFPNQNPHPRLLPYLEEALKKAHGFYLDSEENPDSPYKLFQGLPCWNSEVEKVFSDLHQRCNY